MKTTATTTETRPSAADHRPLSVLMLLFTEREEGTYHRALPWARYLAGAGHRVDLTCVSPGSRFRTRQETVDGVRVIETPNFLDGRRSLRKLSGVSGWGPLDVLARLRLLRRENYDIVHAFEHHPNVSLPILLAGRRRVPLLVADGCDHYGPGGLRCVGARPRLDPAYRILGLPLRTWADRTEGALRRRADAVTVISRALAARAKELGVAPERIQWIPGSVDTRMFSERDRGAARVDRGIPRGARVAFFLGAARFDLDIALEAFAEVARTDAEALLLLAGPASRGLDGHLSRFGLGARVRALGWLDESALSGWLAAADVCLLPLRDTPADRARWPNKIGCYMAAGRPTVCSQVGEVADLVRSEKIGRVTRHTAADFAKQMRWVFNHPGEARAQGLRARALAEQRFDLRIQGAALEALYHRLRRDRRTAASAGPSRPPLPL